MSWQAYVDQSLIGPGNIDKGLICDASGSSTWASTPGFSISEAELKAIAASFSDKSEPKTIISNGFRVGGEKYMTIQSTDEELIGKKGKEGVVIHKTIQAILIGHHGPEAQTTNAFSDVAQLAGYLKKLQY